MLLKLLFRNAFRHKLRTTLTICGICVAVLAFGMLRTVISAWYAGVEASAANRLVIRNSISLIFSLPLSYREKIRSVEEVKQLSYGNWFGGVYITERNFFANFAVEPRSYLALYPEFMLPADQAESFFRDRKACVVGRKLARRFDWKIGDSIPLKGTIFPGNWEFVIRGIYRGRDATIDENQFFFHWDYLNETIKKTLPRRADQVGFYVVDVANPDLAAQTAATIDGLFKNSFAETLTETEKAFQMSFVSLSQAIITAIRLVSFVVIVIILAVMANTMAMSVRERMSEYAVFKTLGFGGGISPVLFWGNPSSFPVWGEPWESSSRFLPLMSFPEPWVTFSLSSLSRGKRFTWIFSLRWRWEGWLPSSPCPAPFRYALPRASGESPECGCFFSTAFETC